MNLQLRSLSSPSEIAHNEDILRIFLMACEVRNVKLSVIGLSCLQKLISHDAVAPSALKEILSTLKDVSSDCHWYEQNASCSILNGLWWIGMLLLWSHNAFFLVTLIVN